jgi:hypothetical protein
MRRPFALVLTIACLAFGATAGIAAPTALAASSATSTAASATAAGTSTSSILSQSENPSSNFGLGNAEANATSQSTTTTANTATVAATSSSGGLSGFDAILIGLIVVLVLVGISFWVWYDARSNVAQLRHGGGTAGDSMFARSHPGSKAPPKPRKPKAAERRRRKRGRAR